MEKYGTEDNVVVDEGRGSPHSEPEDVDLRFAGDPTAAGVPWVH